MEDVVQGALSFVVGQANSNSSKLQLRKLKMNGNLRNDGRSNPSLASLENSQY
jgi:hypothetical protein